eukprot:TRINITY_DN8546_c0_g1_i1.p1 TRINITY_DN8546_c0_g1~~TRINITY_DN8546_c0_g1_i1.p1  ORF type:complete len:286 (+),score=35.41 TRINITY_DN8546_c0_g1_i1:2-859(+)
MATKLLRLFAASSPKAIGIAFAGVTTGTALVWARHRFDELPALEKPFHDDELIKALPLREQSSGDLQAYMYSARQEFHKINTESTPESRQQKLNAFRERVIQDTQIILYGVAEPHARQRYLDEYGCAKWTPEALSVIAELSPLIELGAGQGQWQKALSEVGANAIAFDNESTLQPSDQPVGKVTFGDESKLPWYPLRTLLLVYPPDNDMAVRALQTYTGDYLVYVGEARGGVNTNNDFFDKLEQEWDCVIKQRLDPFPRCYEQLFILRRRQRIGKPWWSFVSAWW